MKIEVTETHIRKGERGGSLASPVALALKDAGAAHACVYGDEFLEDGDGFFITTSGRDHNGSVAFRSPPQLAEWIGSYNDGADVSPITFDFDFESTEFFDMPVGRPTLLTPELQDDICELIALGMSYVAICDAVSISTTAFTDWVARGKVNDGEPYAGFAAAVARANLEARRTVHVSCMDAAKGGDWRAGLELMARRFPEEYSERRIVKHEGGVAVRFAKLDDEALEAEIEKLTEGGTE